MQSNVVDCMQVLIMIIIIILSVEKISNIYATELLTFTLHVVYVDL